MKFTLSEQQGIRLGITDGEDWDVVTQHNSAEDLYLTKKAEELLKRVNIDERPLILMRKKTTQDFYYKCWTEREVRAYSEVTGILLYSGIRYTVQCSVSEGEKMHYSFWNEESFTEHDEYRLHKSSINGDIVTLITDVFDYAIVDWDKLSEYAAKSYMSLLKSAAIKMRLDDEGNEHCYGNGWEE